MTVSGSMPPFAVPRWHEPTDSLHLALEGGSLGNRVVGMRTAEVTLPAVVASVPSARHFTASILTGWGLGHLTWGATLIVSELATNAALHARGSEILVRIVGGEGGDVRIEVRDDSIRLPRRLTYGAEATTGRGLRMVEELAAEWGVTPVAGGKTVWALLVDRDADDEGTLDLDDLLAAFDEPETGSEEGTELNGSPRPETGRLGAAA